MKPTEVCELKDDWLSDVIRIHRAGLGYTLNSRLGHDHLEFLYRSMAGDPSCYVGVARMDERVSGVISGAVDAAKFTSDLMRHTSKSRLARIAARMLIQPPLILAWWQSAVIAAPLARDSREVKAVLTAIAVDPEAQGRGVGRALVNAFEDFLRGHGVDTYRLDTKRGNQRAIDFYVGLGFQLVDRRADSVVLLRRLQ